MEEKNPKHTQPTTYLSILFSVGEFTTLIFIHTHTHKKGGGGGGNPNIKGMSGK